MEPIELGEGFTLSEPTPEDRDSYIQWLAEPIFSRCIPLIPHPYTPSDADAWVEHCERRRANNGRDVTFAIREPGGQLVGLVGAEKLKIGEDFKAEFGYWLALPYHGRGLMTRAVRAYCRVAFEEFGLSRLYAHTLDFNTQSQKVLERCGFQKEGTFRKHVRTPEGIFDTPYYGLLKSEWQMSI